MTPTVANTTTVVGAKNDLKNSLNYVVEAMIASEAYPDLVGAYWKGSLTPKATSSDAPQNNKIISYKGVSIHLRPREKITTDKYSL